MFDYELPKDQRARLVRGDDGVVRLQETVPSYVDKAKKLAIDVALAAMRGDVPAPTRILVLPRGGLVIAEVMARTLGIKGKHVLNMGLNTYTGEGQKGGIEVGQKPKLRHIWRQVVLIPEDVADTGETIAEGTDRIWRMRPKAVLTAALYHKGKCIAPDFFIEQVDPDLWIRFPFDDAEAFGQYFQGQMALPVEQRDIAAMQYDPKVGIHIPSSSRV